MSDNPRDCWFSYGFKSKEAAQESMEDGFAHGELSPCEHPRVESYTIGSGDKSTRRYGVRVTI